MQNAPSAKAMYTWATKSLCSFISIGFMVGVSALGLGLATLAHAAGTQQVLTAADNLSSSMLPLNVALGYFGSQSHLLCFYYICNY